MTNLIIEKLLARTKRTDLPDFAPGDTIRVQVKIKEGEKERLQAFEGVVISRSRGPQASFTVRKISVGQGVEDYYVAPGEARGVWIGAGARELGLGGGVEPEALRRVLGGVDPRDDVPLRSSSSPAR